MFYSMHCVYTKWNHLKNLKENIFPPPQISAKNYKVQLIETYNLFKCNMVFRIELWEYIYNSFNFSITFKKYSITLLHIKNIYLFNVFHKIYTKNTPSLSLKCIFVVYSLLASIKGCAQIVESCEEW